MAMRPADAAELAKELDDLWRTERRKMDRIDRWARWEHDDPHKPRHATAEYRELSNRSQAPWGDLIVGSVAQTLYVEGYRRPSAPDDGNGWRIWQANGFDGKQVALHRAVLTYGIAYGLALPGVDPFTGEPMPVLRGVSPREMIAVYDDPAHDDWPIYAMRVSRKHKRFDIDIFDDTEVHHLTVKDLGQKPEWMSVQTHNAGVCPVVRYRNRFDLEGRSAGEIEPFIPVLGRIDQTAFDRLVVQRFASWIVRTISGMSLSDTANATSETAQQAKLRLKVEDMLVAEDPDTKFGSLPATPLDGFIKAHESDLTVLAATSQTPAFELLGHMANMSAEALAAAKASQTAKSDERKHTLGEDHEQLIRLACHLQGDVEGAADFESQVRWADTTIRSLAQAADAYGKLATMLGVPPQILWPKIPGFTQQDVDEAKAAAEQGGGSLDQLMRELAEGADTFDEV
jgi:hypothetical protein